MKPNRSRLKRWLCGISVVLILALLLAALACYFFPQQILTIDSGPVKADAMVVLGGGLPERAELARRNALFKAGEAPKILVSGNGDCDFNGRLLEKNGVTNTAIILECDSTTTRENAEFSIPLLRKMGARRVIIVTSWFHSRRALACFEHYAPDITFYSRPSYVSFARKDWKPHSIGRYVNAEYWKLIGYLAAATACVYGVNDGKFFAGMRSILLTRGLKKA